jgi:hypothetical protein
MRNADIEHPLHPASGRGTQRSLHTIFDEAVNNDLEKDYAQMERPEHVTRLQELRHPATDHTWLWALHAGGKGGVSSDDYVLAVRARLGIAVGSEAHVCGNCGIKVIDNDGIHIFTCAGGEATKGHTRVRDIVHDLALQADPAAETEPVALAASQPTLRPADVLCTMGGAGQLVAIDVGITHPQSADGDIDACSLYYNKKLAKYAKIIPELEAQGILYKPMIWSSWGRPHEETVVLLRRLSERAARRKGLVSGKALFDETCAKIAVELQARLAGMIRRCQASPEPVADHG